MADGSQMLEGWKAAKDTAQKKLGMACVLLRITVK
jgi:hypothetical protein